MVVDYECGHCRHKVQLGWFHTLFREGFGSASLLMCTACGAQHMVRIALRPDFIDHLRHANDRFRVTLAARGERPVETMAALRQLLGCSLAEAKAMTVALPVTLSDVLPRQDALQLQAVLARTGASVELVSIPPEVPPDVPPQVQDELLVSAQGGERWDRLPVTGDRGGAAGEFDLSLQRCGICASQGTLVSELPSSLQACPRCGATALSPVGSWAS